MQKRFMTLLLQQFQELEHKHTTNYSSSVGAAIFVDVDILAVAEKQKVVIKPPHPPTNVINDFTIFA